MSDKKEENVAMETEESHHIEKVEETESLVLANEKNTKNKESVVKVDEFDGRRRTRSSARGIQVLTPPPAKKERLSKSVPKTKETSVKRGSRGRPRRIDNEKEENSEITTKVEVHTEPIKTDASETSPATSKVKKNEPENSSSPLKENSTEKKMEPESTQKDGEKDPAEEKFSADKKEDIKNASGENKIETTTSTIDKVKEKVISVEKASGDPECVFGKKTSIEDQASDVTAANGEKASAEKGLTQVAE